MQGRHRRGRRSRKANHWACVRSVAVLLRLLRCLLLLLTLTPPREPPAAGCALPFLVPCPCWVAHPASACFPQPHAPLTRFPCSCIQEQLKLKSVSLMGSCDTMDTTQPSTDTSMLLRQSQGTWKSGSKGELRLVSGCSSAGQSLSTSSSSAMPVEAV